MTGGNWEGGRESAEYCVDFVDGFPWAPVCNIDGMYHNGAVAECSGTQTMEISIDDTNTQFSHRKHYSHSHISIMTIITCNAHIHQLQHEKKHIFNNKTPSNRTTNKIEFKAKHPSPPSPPSTHPSPPPN